MSWSGRGWFVATSVGAVEAMKDQGFCRWNYALRLLQQRANTNLMRSFTLASKPRREQHKFKQSEDSLRKVMYLSCWGPN